ncbi:Pentatricopeptide repeat [Parasponia andersonii]|uniref:Pentatricopeptide repeat n=1 Tax=Parasponia andersonii TaxID=3476 RepID=A0A2P5C1Y4_PARAD|nr:Pentatricopeptide repeat [Parasponia andersonii]
MRLWVISIPLLGRDPCLPLGLLISCLGLSPRRTIVPLLSLSTDTLRFALNLIISDLMSVQTYSVLIDSVCKEDKNGEAVSLFELMTRQVIEPDVVTFNALISALCKSSQSDEAAQFLKNMTSRGISPDIVTYNIMLDSLCKERRN